MGVQNKTKYVERKIDPHNTEQQDDGDVRCGYGDCRPASLQSCNSPRVLLLVMCIFSLTHGFIVNGINNINTQTYERRFGFTSANAGLISSAHEFSAAVFSLILSFIGSGMYKGRWLAVGSMLAGLGSLVMVLPHFTTGLYDWGQYTEIPVCQVNSTTPEDCFDGNLQNYLGMFIGGMCLIGIGASIQYTIGVGYIDDSVTADKSPLYIGTLYAISIIGPGIGFVLGGRLLSIYVDYDKVDTDTVPLNDKDPRWVGAWWPPFFISMVVFFLVVIPLSLFGSELPTADMVRKTRNSQTHKAYTKSMIAARDRDRQPIRMVIKTTWQLIKNVPFTLLVFSAVFRSFNVAGLSTFFPKYFQNRYNQSPASAATFTGAIAVPGAVIGTFVGGLICNRMKLKVKGMIRLSIISAVIGICSTGGLWISCEKAPLAGINTAYDVSGEVTENIVHPCSENCGCKTKYYRPVCAEDKLQYFSACHAGCTRVLPEIEEFQNCTCLDLAAEIKGSSVKGGVCDLDCNNVYIFAALMFLNTLCMFLVLTPGDASTLRCIDESQRTYSMGLKHFIARLLGTVPGPVIYGLVTDSSCLVWQSVCGDDTSCWIYNQDNVGRNYFLLAASMDALSVVFMCLALYFYKPPPEDVTSEEEKLDQENVTASSTTGRQITHM